MFDIKRISEYRENNRFEGKKAEGGLPNSIWETYSAFANSYGGLILLGAIENKDGSFTVNGIANPDAMIKVFWDTINNRSKVSANILRDKNVYTDTLDGKTVIVIEVPRALRQDKPVYINGNLFAGTFRRNGEGDYHCTESEVKNMLRDAGDITQDHLVLEKVSLDALDKETVARYRMRFSNLKPKHVWTPLNDELFLQKIGAVKRGEEDGVLHPTIAGLLMFGRDTEICNEFPNYFLDYREPFGTTGTRWTDRVTSGTGDWSGNLYDFYFRIQDRLTADVKVPFVLKNGQDRIDETSMHEALREALANALIHSDYYERRGLVVEKKKDEIAILNPGALRIPKDEALAGGISDPRNRMLFSMFALIGIGERAGSGLANIKSVWADKKLPEPKLSEQFNPDRTILILPLAKNVVDNVVESVVEKTKVKLTKKEKDLLELLKTDGNLTIAETAERLGFDSRTVQRGLRKLRENNIIMRIGSDRAGEWRIVNSLQQ